MCKEKFRIEERDDENSGAAVTPQLLKYLQKTVHIELHSLWNDFFIIICL